MFAVRWGPGLALPAPNITELDEGSTAERGRAWPLESEQGSNPDSTTHGQITSVWSTRSVGKILQDGSSLSHSQHIVHE